ncbi:hypothetical protein [Actinomadura gamaensis]|uniref:N-acetyltransferase domain-containing protein n=1 Tax=Actinomadura gamaensis TaxID=1763541 RepID=A0ABV9TVY1_9ACTN
MLPFFVRSAVADGVTVTPVRSAASRAAFVALPYRLYRDDRLWVPPRRGDCRRRLSRRRNPFFDHADVALFLAHRGREVVGRIAAVHNHRPPQSHRDREGFFGQFECADDPEAAAALVRAAGDWLRGRGLVAMTGPVNFTTSDECGTLIEGFDLPPVVMSAYNPSYHAALLEGCGLVKAKDLYSWQWTADGNPLPDAISKIAQRAARGGVTVRPLELRDFRAEVARLRSLFNSTVSPLWGMQPFSDREFTDLATRLRPWARPEFLLIAEVRGRPVGTLLAVPDVNRALAAARGAPPVVRTARALRAVRSIDHGRVLALGVAAEYRLRGVEAILVERLAAAGLGLGMRSAEIGWTLEDNTSVNRTIARLGCRRTKVHRLWRRDL